MKPYYQDDSCTIYHGDVLDVVPSLANVTVTVTSPPYNTLGSRIPSRPSGMHSTNGWMAKVSARGYADDMGEDEYTEWQSAVMAAIAGVTNQDGAAYYNHKIRYRDRRPIHPLVMVDAFPGWSLRQEIVWDRRGAIAFNARMFAPSDERIYWLVRDVDAFRWNQPSASHLTVWGIPPPVDVDGDHPCPFPDAIPKRCISASSDPGETVLDPFMGSGTTLRAAKDLGRKAIGIELEERFCEMAVHRLAQGVLAL